jgi:hypothetical protein
MAKVEYQFPVDKIHGRVSKQHKIGFAHRKLSKLNYTTSYGVRSTKPSNDEIKHRNKFAAVVAAARARMRDPGKIAQDSVAFRNQSTYPTMWSYLFNMEWQAYEA